MLQKLLFVGVLCALLAACASSPAGTAAPADGPIPAFDHVFLIVLENRSFPDVIGNPKMPRLNALAQENVLLTEYTGVAHPSLPNYIALISGDTFGIKKDCKDCYLQAESLADRLEASGRVWKTYQEDMPEPCFLGSEGNYVQKHNPFIYFDNIRLDAERCAASDLPLTALEDDLAGGKLPDFALIMPNMCHSGHDCDAEVADAWVGDMVERLVGAPALRESQYLIVITYDESMSSGGFQGLVSRLTGQYTERIVTVLISPDGKPGFEDSTPYNHYSLLKTILLAWDLPALGHTADGTVNAIRAPWGP